MIAGLVLVAALSAEPAALRFTVDPEQSLAEFFVATTWHEVHGWSRALAGSIELPHGLAAGEARIEVALAADSLDTGNGKRDADIRGRFLAAAEHPRIVLRARAIRGDLAAAGSGAPFEATLDGDLEARGVAVPVEVRASCRLAGAALRCRARFETSLAAHAIPGPSRWFAKASDRVRIEVRLVARLSDGGR